MNNNDDDHLEAFDDDVDDIMDGWIKGDPSIFATKQQVDELNALLAKVFVCIDKPIKITITPVQVDEHPTVFMPPQVPAEMALRDPFGDWHSAWPFKDKTCEQAFIVEANRENLYEGFGIVHYNAEGFEA